jgi:serine/threonine-protein kinase
MADGSSFVYEQAGLIGGRPWAIRIGDRTQWVAAAGAGSPALWVGLLASVLAAALAQASSSVLRLRRQVRAARRLGQYALVEKLGEGGMGTVYRAHHALLRRPTAVKLLHAARNSPAALERFEREVQLTSALTHPNTVIVYDYGRTPDGVFYYAMEYIDGLTLQDLVDLAGAQSAERVVHILAQVCAALAEAHAVGLVHRDIKPANIMLCKRGGALDFVKVLDFGLVKDLSDSSSGLSQSVALVGTPLYIAPEVIQARGQVDARVDLYALGAVAYFLLSGTPVFTGQTLIEVCAKQISLPAEPLSLRMGEGKVPAELEQLVLRCLERDPAARPASAEELRQSLTALAVSPWGPEQARRWWDERGPAVTAAARARSTRHDSQPGNRTLDVDRGRDAGSQAAP